MEGTATGAEGRASKVWKLVEGEGGAVMNYGKKYRIGDVLLDSTTRRVKRDGRWRPLPERSLAALLALIAAGDQGCSFAALMRAAWDGAVVGEDTIKKRISLLRHDLGDIGETPRLILSLRGRGYRLAEPAEPVSAHRFPSTWVAGFATYGLIVQSMIGVHDWQIRRIVRTSRETSLPPYSWRRILLSAPSGALVMFFYPVAVLRALLLKTHVWRGISYQIVEGGIIAMDVPTSEFQSTEECEPPV